MPTPIVRRPAASPAVPFTDVCHLIDQLIDVRPDILSFAGDTRTLEQALLRLREGELLPFVRGRGQALGMLLGQTETEPRTK